MFTGYFKALNFNKALEALVLAEEKHNGQFRKSGEPYISHPIRVCSSLISLGIVNEVVFCASLLHDVLEDTTATEDDLRRKFDDKTVDVIILLTKKSGMSTELYYKEIEKSPEATIIKLADRCHNASTMTFFKEGKREEYVDETEKYAYRLCSKGADIYPEWSNQIYALKYQIESLVDATKCGLDALYEANKKIEQLSNKVNELMKNSDK